MEFRISDTFTDSLTRLTGDEQKSVKTTAFDLQIDPVNPGMQFHRIHRCKDPNFWSVRAGRDIRVIVHKTDASLLLCYVDQHDAAYAWAERRRIERHPRTGAAQSVASRLESASDTCEPGFVCNTARHLLHAACTIARDYLLVTAVDTTLELPNDLGGATTV